MPVVSLPSNGVLKRLEHLFSLIVPVPEDWIDTGSSETDSQPAIECKPCDRYSVLSNAWKKALQWTPGLDRALSVMLASIASTKLLGDQLWIKIIGPAACGKSTLCEAVSVNRKHVIAKSTIRGFHSGYGHESEDHSLVNLLYDKTLVTKDGDTLLQSPNLEQILAEARDLYDSTARTHYRTGRNKDYQGVRMTWLLCGTSSLRQIDHSELGERFLDCVIMDSIDDELEDEILMRVAYRTDRNLSTESNGKLTSQHDPDLVEAMQLTGGYVDWLRDNATDVLSTIETPRQSLYLCTRLAKFVALMRARPSTRQEESAERELGSRLASQLVRLAKCLALVLNHESVDNEVMLRVRQVALDTARGQTLALAAVLYNKGTEGSEAYPLTVHFGLSNEKISSLLRFLQKIGVVERFTPLASENKGRLKNRWRLTPTMRRIYREVFELTRKH